MKMQSLVTAVGIATDKAALLEDTGEQAPEVPEEPASEAWQHCLRALEATDPQS